MCPSIARIGPTHFQRHLPLLIPATPQRIMTHTRLCVVLSCSSQNHPAAFLQWFLWAFVFFLYFYGIFHFPLFCGPNLLSWGCELIISQLRVEEDEFRQEKCCYLCIGLTLSGTDILLQLKIIHGLADFDVIDRSWMLDCYVCMYL